MSYEAVTTREGCTASVTEKARRLTSSFVGDSAAASNWLGGGALAPNDTLSLKKVKDDRSKTSFDFSLLGLINYEQEVKIQKRRKSLGVEIEQGSVNERTVIISPELSLRFECVQSRVTNGVVPLEVLMNVLFRLKFSMNTAKGCPVAG